MTNPSPHESLRDDEVPQAGSDRSFGLIVGGIMMVIGAAKAGLAGALTPFAALLFAVGLVLVLFGLVAPARLATAHRLWLRLGAAIAAVVNPVVMAVLFFLVVTPMALLMRALGKRPLRLAADPGAATYWIAREPEEGAQTSMPRQF